MKKNMKIVSVVAMIMCGVSFLYGAEESVGTPERPAKGSGEASAQLRVTPTKESPMRDGTENFYYNKKDGRVHTTSMFKSPSGESLGNFFKNKQTEISRETIQGISASLQRKYYITAADEKTLSGKDIQKRQNALRIIDDIKKMIKALDDQPVETTEESPVAAPESQALRDESNSSDQTSPGAVSLSVDFAHVGSQKSESTVNGKSGDEASTLPSSLPADGTNNNFVSVSSGNTRLDQNKVFVNPVQPLFAATPVDTTTQQLSDSTSVDASVQQQSTESKDSLDPVNLVEQVSSPSLDSQEIVSSTSPAGKGDAAQQSSSKRFGTRTQVAGGVTVTAAVVLFIDAMVRKESSILFAALRKGKSWAKNFWGWVQNKKENSAPRPKDSLDRAKKLIEEQD